MKKLIFIILIVCFTANLFCKDVYSGADKQTKEILEAVDNLLKKKQYQTAFGKVSIAYNEYILAKKIEIAINGFALSMMHQMFTFKDLEENETLEDVRNATDVTYSLILFDPVKEIKNFQENNGEKPILNYSLGLYYQDVLERYGSNWLISTDELTDNVILYLQKALDQGCYDAYSLSTLATSYYSKNDLNSAIAVYKQKEKEFKLTATDNYHYSSVLLFSGNPKAGINYIKKAIEGYKDNPEYQADAYIIAARIGMAIPDYKMAEKYLVNGKKLFPQNYRIPQYSVGLYSLQNNKKKAVSSAMELFAFAPENPTVCRMIIEQCGNAGKNDFAIAFFEEAVIEYKDNSKACENLYFHFADLYHTMGKYTEAKEMAANARIYFERNGTLTDEIDKMLKVLSRQGD